MAGPLMLTDDFITEYNRYRALGEKSMSQISDDALNALPEPESNSIAMIVRHISGNFASRFTDFLTADGEKPWRDRDGEFATRQYTRVEVDELWRAGWAVVEHQLKTLSDADLEKSVTIRGQTLTVHAALSRSLAHVAYHVGQMVVLARVHVGAGWQSLSIPKGKSGDYNRAPTLERGHRPA
jgi:uncharacterized damage-inducible protein DinB